MSTPQFEYPRQGGSFVVASVADVANRTFEGFERLAHLNLQTVKTTLAEQEEIAQEAVSSHSLEWLVTLPSAQAQASFTKTLAYWHHVNSITVETVTNNMGSSWESLTECAKWATSLFVDAASRVPAGGSPSLAAPDAHLPGVDEAEAEVAAEVAASAKPSGKKR